MKAVIYDAPMLLYYAKNNPDKKLGVVGELFEKQSYGIARAAGQPLSEGNYARDSCLARAGFLRGAGEQILRHRMSGQRTVAAR